MTSDDKTISALDSQFNATPDKPTTTRMFSSIALLVFHYGNTRDTL